MSDESPCWENTNHPLPERSPFDQVLILGWYDGLEEGLIRCGKCKRVHLFNLRSAHPPDIILEYPPAGHRIVDEWHYAETRCAPSAPRTAEFSHRRHAGFPTVIAKTRAGSVMVHVTTTLRLAPTHSFLESSPTKVSQPAHREFREFFTETTST